MLNLASNIWLWECEHANVLRKNIEDIRIECNQLARCRDDMQLYLEKIKLSRRAFYWIKKRLNIWSSNPKVLDALNTQISKVCSLLKNLVENQELLYTDISKTIWNNQKN